MADTITIEVFRYRPEDGAEPVYDTFDVPLRQEWRVLDALNHVKDEVDGSLTFRWSCRMGVCGSCGMMVNGVPKLTCSAFLRDFAPGPIRIDPLDGFPVERDLVTVLDDFMGKLSAVTPWMVHKDERSVEQGEYRQSPAELAQFKQYSMCINCTLCYAACPVYTHEDDFLGPAVLALAQRYNLDSRDDGNEQRYPLIWSDSGIWDCTFVGECSVVCPKHVDPSAAIQQAKVQSAQSFFASFLPFGKR
ncbi:MAG: succinate dehydrogenase/fumarate reductase iron-sulfur subunit [Dehalococcoidia bacterium]|jgi:fumarate reductase iron-sulfur subunit|nr:succinate dehydrogenase/fumarate reductase iron-sulfur subunit [Dehalococcoidia bacterium]